jgi:hypothetical protein
MSLSDKLKDAVRLAVREYSRKSGRDVSLTDTTIPATVLFIDLHRRLGAEWPSWEPETLWLTLPEVTPVNRDKILAAASLASNPAFYWDWRVAGNTALAFANVPGFPEHPPEPTPEQLAWAVFEAELIFALSDDEDVTPSFDDEVAGYVAAVLHHNGWVQAPDILAFCQEHLTGLLNADAKELAAKVKTAWEAHPRTDLEQSKFEDTALGVQLSRQANVLRYLEQRADQLRNAL